MMPVLQILHPYIADHKKAQNGHGCHAHALQSNRLILTQTVSKCRPWAAEELLPRQSSSSVSHCHWLQSPLQQPLDGMHKDGRTRQRHTWDQPPQHPKTKQYHSGSALSPAVAQAAVEAW